MSQTTPPGQPEPSERREALHTTLPIDFEDAVPFVQVEHELAGFETVTLTSSTRLKARESSRWGSRLMPNHHASNFLLRV